MKRSEIWKIQKEHLEEIISLSSSVSEVLRRLGMKTTCGGTYRTLMRRIKEEKINIDSLNRWWKSSEVARNKKYSLDEILVENSPYQNLGRIKKRLLDSRIISNECKICGMKGEWHGRPLVLILDHINGNSSDHRLENLRMVCPNCNSQLPTFAGRNKKK